MLQISHLSADYGGKPALADINLTLDSGELLVVLGPSGCGKTTLLKTILGIIPPVSGKVELGEFLEPGYFEQEEREKNERFHQSECENERTTDLFRSRWVASDTVESCVSCVRLTESAAENRETHHDAHAKSRETNSAANAASCDSSSSC